MKYLYETHMHTAPASACALCTPAEQVRTYKNRGYTGIIITDHFFNGNSGCPKDLPWDKKMEFFADGYKKAKEEGGRIGLDVFFGLEYGLEGTEFLTYGLTPELLFASKDMDKMTVAEYSAFVRKNGGYLAQAHPFRLAWWIKTSVPADPSLMDGIEVYNAGDSDEINAKARVYAELHNLPVQAGSDSHSADRLIYSGIALPRKANDIFDIIDAIKTGQAELITPCYFKT